MADLTQYEIDLAIETMALEVLETWPRLCWICGYWMDDEDDCMWWHGIGNCVSICWSCCGEGCQNCGGKGWLA